ncbi:MAG: sugar transferase [Gemmatimonadota bacterium]
MSKRAVDLGLVVAGGALALPVMAFVALGLRLFQGSPVLFRQTRLGLGGRPFELVKFRTMTEGRDADGELLPDRDRLTPLGRFLRRTSLDELPTLWNVLRGEMSMVGPRPLLPQYLGRYSSEQARRHEVPPGITGWAQVHGRNAVGWEDRFRLDVWYVDHRSLLLDLSVLWRTVWVVLRGHGIHQEGEATMQEFQGSDSPERSSTEGSG